MVMRGLVVVACWAWLFVMPAAAEESPTTVEGHVVDVLGRPVANARVYVLPRQGEPILAKTDKAGRYRARVQTLGTHGVVIAIDRAHTFRTVIVQAGAANALDIEVDVDTQGGEVIKIEDKRRPEPKIQPKPVVDPRINLPYSEEAVERDAWARAWLLLDVDEEGKVTRLKMLKRPGFDLDAICIEEGLGLRFEPARDHAGRPMKTYMLWTFEWPAWGWLIQGNGVAVRRPADHNDMHHLHQNSDIKGTDMVLGVDQKIGGLWARHRIGGTVFEGALDRVPCAGSGPLNLDLRNRAYRDCSQPDLSMAEALPWITKDTAQTAVAELANPRLRLVEDRDPGARWPGYVAAGVSGLLAIGAIVSYTQYDRYIQQIEDTPWQSTISIEEAQADARGRDRWGRRTLVLTTAALMAGGATLLLWNRNAPRSSFSVQPAEHGSGAGASYARAW